MNWNTNNFKLTNHFNTIINSYSLCLFSLFWLIFAILILFSFNFYLQAFYKLKYILSLVLWKVVNLNRFSSSSFILSGIIPTRTNCIEILYFNVLTTVGIAIFKFVVSTIYHCNLCSLICFDTFKFNA